MTHCDKCFSKIQNEKCGCGLWWDKKDKRVSPYLIFKQALEAYEMHVENGTISEMFSSDLAGKDIQCIFFKGTLQESECLKQLLVRIRDAIAIHKADSNKLKEN